MLITTNDVISCKIASYEIWKKRGGGGSMPCLGEAVYKSNKIKSILPLVCLEERCGYTSW